jgi:hypothetical protein
VLVTPPPPRGGQLLTSCCAFAACACFQVTSCVLLKVRVYLSCWAWTYFPTGGGLQACFVLLHPCLRILLAIYSEATACMRQLMCTAVSRLRSSDQISSSHSIIVHISCTLHVYFSYISMVLLLMFLSPPLRGAGPMALMLGHEWQHTYIIYILYII